VRSQSRLQTIGTIEQLQKVILVQETQNQQFQPKVLLEGRVLSKYFTILILYAFRNEDFREFNQMENKLVRKDQKEQDNPQDIVLVKRQLTPEEIQEMK
jgi:hypothetical protein